MKDSGCAVIIPARYASTRFPGKPLALLAGKPMIRHVYEKAAASKAAVVAVRIDIFIVFPFFNRAQSCSRHRSFRLGPALAHSLCRSNNLAFIISKNMATLRPRINYAQS